MSAPEDLARFHRILEAARTRKASLDGETLIPQAHLAQMRLFMLRQGVEFFPKQDSFGARREFVRRVVEHNQLLSRIEAIIDSFLIDGKGLFFFRPSKDLYRIHYFRGDQYRAYRDEDGEVSELIIIYSFKVRPESRFGTGAGLSTSADSPQITIGPSNTQTRWLKMKVFRDRIEQWVSHEKPQFDGLESGSKAAPANPFGFIPAVEVFNNRSLEEGEGYGEFDWMAGHILEHDRMVRSVKSNLHFFGNPTLVSSRPKHDLMEPDDDGNATPGRATIASNNGFASASRASTRVSEPSYMGGGLRVPRIISNVEAADRVSYIVPDAVGGDLTGFTAMYQEAIRSTLGGVDDMSINSGATAYEVRTIYGRVAATAKRKCRDLYDYGLCRLFQLMVSYEETLFRESVAFALKINKPEPPLEERLPPEQRAKIVKQYDEEKLKWNQAVGEAIANIKETGQVPPQVLGLLPDGDTSILWRWQGEVFEDSKQEILQASIVCRNLQELGVDSLEALQFLFPSKTPEERAAMLGGYPFRIAEATQRSVGIFIDTIRAFFQTPHPQEPDLPLAADPSLDLTPFLYRTLAHLRTELNYGGRYSDLDATIGTPGALDDGDRLRASLGLPTAADRRTAERRRAFAQQLRNGSPAAGRADQLGFSSAMAGAGQPERRASYADSPAFGVGGPLGYDPIAAEFSAAGELGSDDPFPGGMGDPDLRAPTNSGVLPAPAPPGGASSGPGKRRSSGPGSRR